jgi:hypothetical protein
LRQLAQQLAVRTYANLIVMISCASKPLHQRQIAIDSSISLIHFDFFFLDSTFLLLALPVTQTKRQRGILVD